MAKYNPTVTTNKGEALIVKLMAGDVGELEFTRIALSDKDYTDADLAKVTSLEQIKQETLVSEKTRVDENNINIHGIIYNTDLLEGYNLKTIGLYATDPDEGDILYSVTTAIKADYVTEADEHNVGSVIIDLMTKVSKAPVNMKGNPSALVDVFMLNKKLDKGEGLEEEYNTAVKIVKKIKEILAELAKKATKITLGRIIVGKGMTADSAGRVSVISKNDGILINDNDIQLNIIDNITTDSITRPLSAKQGKKLNEEKQNITDNSLPTEDKTIVGAIKEIFTELWKTGSTTQFGRFKVGTNLSVDANGFLNGNPSYTHPSGSGNTHLPAGGAAGQFIKWLSAGVGQWAAITWGDITGKPTTFTPSAHNQAATTITEDSTHRFVTDTEKSTWNGKAPASHTHSKSQITDFAHSHTKNQISDFPTALKNPTSLTIQTNGTSQGAYDGETAKTINITAANIGAEPAFNKNNAFNKNFGTVANTVLDGAKLAETLGIPYGGILNNANAKTVGTAYYDNTTKKTYKCTVANSLNYADSTKFEAISNNDLLLKLQNLSNWESGSNSNGFWFKEKIIGLKIAYRRGIAIGQDSTITITLPIIFTTTNYIVNAQAEHLRNDSWGNNLGINIVDTSSFKVHSSGTQSPFSFIAIGY